MTDNPQNFGRGRPLLQGLVSLAGSPIELFLQVGNRCTCTRRFTGLWLVCAPPLAAPLSTAPLHFDPLGSQRRSILRKSRHPRYVALGQKRTYRHLVETWFSYHDQISGIAACPASTPLARSAAWPGNMNSVFWWRPNGSSHDR